MSTQARILSILKNNNGRWISGENLSAEVNISRAAVWKHMCKLKQDGYMIESLPRKGYLLRRTSDQLLPEEIRQDLGTVFLGKKAIHHFNSLESTNTLAKELAVQGAAEGTLVLAETQTAGRGRKGRYWFSPPGEGICLSMILRPDLSPFEVPRLTLLSAVAAADSVRNHTGLTALVKWPNDLFLGQRKLAGILTEISTDMDAVNHVIVGLGLNVNTAVFPPELSGTATSLFLESGRTYSRVGLLRQFLQEFETLYQAALSQGFDSVIQRLRTMTNTIGRRVTVTLNHQTHSGTAQDIDHDGALLIMDDNGRSLRVLSGDVNFV